MTLAFLNMGTPEVLAIIFFIALLLYAVANYGKDTLLLAILTTPVIAFVVVFFLRLRSST